MDSALLLAFWALSISLALTPGADWAYAIAAGLRERAIAPALSGMMLGYVVITAVVAAGVGALVSSMPVAMTAITLVGAAYLFYLGVGVLRNPPVPEAGEEAKVSWSQWFVRGFGVSGINPKALLLFLAILPQFTSRVAHWPIAGQIVALGAIHIVNCTLVYTAVSLSSSAVLKTRPQIARLVSQTSGLVMIVIAALLIVEQWLQLQVA